jgi:hypothetical protein
MLPLITTNNMFNTYKVYIVLSVYKGLFGNVAIWKKNDVHHCPLGFNYHFFHFTHILGGPFKNCKIEFNCIWYIFHITHVLYFV